MKYPGLIIEMGKVGHVRCGIAKLNRKIIHVNTWRG